MKWKKVCLIFLGACCFPYVVTLGWTGSVSGSERVLERMGNGNPSLTSGKIVILDRDTTSFLDVEQYLVGVVARQIPAEYELEALKAQAVIARTYIYQQMAGAAQIPESSLDMDYLEEAQLERMWGTKQFMELYGKIEQAVWETNGLVMEYEGSYIDAWFSRCSAGKTRPGDEAHPYLASVDCPKDLEADGYLQIKEWTPDEFSRLISSIPDGGPVSADQVPETIQIGARDEAGYVSVVQIGNYQFTGDEVRYALNLNSSFFRLEDYEGNVRAVVKGIGHGYGMSQYDANRKAAEGWGFEEILHYFYQNIMLISE
ncbi:MAG: SpoIID/LytB domain-containing protein [Lachnospiraceae bacterium]|nr:SpoIID/LytB domain-containing protein [Lachnospiraceae bacterium]